MTVVDASAALTGVNQLSDRLCVRMQVEGGIQQHVRGDQNNHRCLAASR